MCWAILRASEQNNKANVQSYNSMPWWPSIQRSIGIGWRIVKSMLSHCPEMLILGTYWKTWYSMVSNTLARAVTKVDKSMWQNAWLVWFLTFITQVNLSNMVMWETVHINAGWDCFRTLTLPETLKTLSQLQGILSTLGRHKFVPISWMCTKQTSVSHSSTESEIISLDAGLRMDGIPALDHWDLVTEVAFFIQPT